MLIALTVYLGCALFMTILAGLLIHDDHTFGQVQTTRNMVKWAWGWPILFPISLIRGWIKLIPTEYFRKLRKLDEDEE